MKNALLIILVIICSMFYLQSNAQFDDKKWNVSIGFKGGIPLGGDIKPFYSLEDGADLRFSYKLGNGFATLSGGVNVYTPTKRNAFGVAAFQIPFLIGYKYKVVPHYFVMGEVGYSMFKSKYGTSNAVSETVSGFTYAPSIGRDFGPFDLSFRYEGILVKGSGSPSDYIVGHLDLCLRVDF
jgi:hypothetical protein